MNFLIYNFKFVKYSYEKRIVLIVFKYCILFCEKSIINESKQYLSYLIHKKIIQNLILINYHLKLLSDSNIL